MWRRVLFYGSVTRHFLARGGYLRGTERRLSTIKAQSLNPAQQESLGRSMVDDYLCVTVRSRPDEREAAFKNRLVEFWTVVLREHPDVYLRVYAETSKFEQGPQVLTRQYLIEASAAEELEVIVGRHQLDVDPIDEDEIYSKYDAAPPEWFWIPH